MNMALDSKLEQVLFDEFAATYNIRRGAARYNADSDIAEVCSYLGTYFPRSWAEHTMIWEKLLQRPSIQSSLSSQETIRILDIGSGTGGHLYAVISQLRSIIKRSRIRVVAIDANERALEKQQELHERLMFNGVNIKYLPNRFNYDATTFGQQLQDICEKEGGNFDIILSSKFLSEMGGYAITERKSPTGFFLNVLYVADKVLLPNGIMSLVDVNIPVGDQHVAEHMRREIMEARRAGVDLCVVMPSHCGLYFEGCCQYNARCYMTIPFELCHKGCVGRNDISKICFRVLARKSLAKLLFAEKSDYPTRIKVNDNGYCNKGIACKGTIDNQYANCFC